MFSLNIYIENNNIIYESEERKGGRGKREGCKRRREEGEGRREERERERVSNNDRNSYYYII